jgi:predicted metal-dependent enzyme (double-stranded beta helix superfamily)
MSDPRPPDAAPADALPVAPPVRRSRLDPTRWFERLGAAGATLNATTELRLRHAEAALSNSVADRLGRPRPLPTAVLADIANRVGRHEPLWRAVAHHDPRERLPIRLIRAERYEVWVIGWTHRQGVVLHDHGGSAAAVAVVEGTLAEEALEEGVPRYRRLEAGSVREMRPGTLHSIANRWRPNATSIHVYSPPLAIMTHYEAESLRPTGSERVDGGAPALPTSVAAALLHPAGSPR